MKPIVVVGYRGRMVKVIVEVLQAKKIPYFFWSESAPSDEKVDDFSACSGVIDFSAPDRSKKAVLLAMAAKIPYVCGTTGWVSPESAETVFAEAIKKIPVVYDSNFSVGIEMLSKSIEAWGNLDGHKVILTDVHHRHKKDSPSGTAKKIDARLRQQTPNLDLEFRDYRIGENAGEHSVMVDLGEEVLEISHRVFDRKVFAKGALRALEWSFTQKPGLYRMKDMLS